MANKASETKADTNEKKPATRKRRTPAKKAPTAKKTEVVVNKVEAPKKEVVEAVTGLSDEMVTFLKDLTIAYIDDEIESLRTLKINGKCKVILSNEIIYNKLVDKLKSDKLLVSKDDESLELTIETDKEIVLYNLI